MILRWRLLCGSTPKPIPAVFLEEKQGGKSTGASPPKFAIISLEPDFLSFVLGPLPPPLDCAEGK